MYAAYLLFFPIVILVGLAVYVLLQDPRGRANRVFALYMLDLVVATYAILVMATTPSPALATASAGAILVTIFCLNAPFLLLVVLSLHYRRHLTRWYGWPLLLAIGVAFAGGVIADLWTRQGLFVVVPPEMGHGYVPADTYMLGPLVLPLRLWFFGGIAASLVLLVLAWFRTPQQERTPITWLIVSLLASGAITPLLPSHPLTPTISPIFFSIIFALVVGRYRVFLPAEVALSAVFESAGEGMIICDRDGQVEQVNPVVEHLTGVSREEMCGRPLPEALALLRDRAQEQELLSLEALALGESRGPFNLLVHLEGPERRILAVTGVPIRDRRDRPLGCFLTLRDVTEQEQIRQSLEVQARLAETIRELAAPIVPVMAGVLILPLVGTIDSERARHITDDMLQAIARQRARVLLIDITGVPVVDTMVADLLIRAVRSARLLGCEAVLVGIRAEVAQTMIHLGVDLGGLVTRRSLQDGLEYARALLGRGG